MVSEQSELYDVVVIGGGVIGCAVLRECTRYQLKSLLVEQAADLAEGISKANSGVIHAGFNVPPGTLKAKMNVGGLFKIYDLARELNVPHEKTGKLVVSLNDEGKDQLLTLKEQGDKNGAPGLELVDRTQIQQLEPLACGKWALWSPHTGIISPFQFTIALAECAWQNGAQILLETPVEGIVCKTSYFVLKTPRAAIKTRWIINSAGLFSDQVARLAGINEYQIFPYRGEYLITDKDDQLNLHMPIYPLPPKDSAGLGVHITPTMERNILLGPSADPIEDKRDTASTRRIMNQLKKEAYQLIPELRRLSFIHSYAGIRPKLIDPNGNIKFKDFVIAESETVSHWINLIGIESPGLTAAPAIARRVLDMIGEKEELIEKPDFNPERPAFPRFAELDDSTRQKLVSENSDWGEMVCRCETVTRAEVMQTLNNPFQVHTLDGIKRRSRCGMGRCQGGFCTPRIVEILRQKGFALEELTKRGYQSRLFYGKIKE